MATYTADQIHRYFQHIGWPAQPLPAPGHGNGTTLPLLRSLMTRQLSAVPFESLSLHYSPTHTLSLAHNDLFAKVVDHHCGGYCMENNTFFGTVLRSLGFTVTPVGGRVSFATTGRPGNGYAGWSHMVNIVTIDNVKYLVDVGFGANGPTKPLPLVSGEETAGIGTTRFKLTYTALPGHTDRTQRMWMFSFRGDDDAPWVDAYAFTEMEFFPEDFEVMNLSTMTLRQSFFVQSVFCVKMAVETWEGGVEEDGEGVEGVGWLTLHGEKVTRKIARKPAEGLQELKTEEERVEALKRWFGIELSEAEKGGIQGLSTEIRGWKMA